VAARRVYVYAPVAGFDPQAYERVLTVFRSRGAEVVSSRALFGSSEQ
jgi:acetolactate synthase regulatory subunit